MKVKNTSDKERNFMPTHLGESGVSFIPGEEKDLPDHVAFALVAGKNDIIEVKSRKSAPTKTEAPEPKEDKPEAVTSRSHAAAEKASSRKAGGSRGSRRGR